MIAVDCRTEVSWLNHNRRLSKDYELLTKASATIIYTAMTRLILRRLAQDQQES